MATLKPDPKRLLSLFSLGLFLALCRGESRRPLRPDSGLQRRLTNLVLATLGLLSAHQLQTRAQHTLLKHPRPRLIKSLPDRLKTLLFAIAMDYGMYHWHRLMHRNPVLWRFHRVHHVDRGLDTSTALRFHPGELLLALPWRLSWIWLLRPSAQALKLWERLFFISVLFHHANLRLPKALDKALAWLIVTPRLHSIHHSRQAKETDSNFSAGLTVWDRLHGTFRRETAHAPTIGSPDGPAQDPDLSRLLMLPFRDRLEP